MVVFFVYFHKILHSRLVETSFLSTGNSIVLFWVFSASGKCYWNLEDLFRIMETRVLARKLKLTSFSGNWEIRLTFTTVDDKKFFFLATTRRTLQNSILGKNFQSMTYNTHKSPPKKVFFLFIINLVGILNKSRLVWVR